jgi:hypothetical protein
LAQWDPEGAKASLSAKMPLFKKTAVWTGMEQAGIGQGFIV